MRSQPEIANQTAIEVDLPQNCLSLAWHLAFALALEPRELPAYRAIALPEEAFTAISYSLKRTTDSGS